MAGVTYLLDTNIWLERLLGQERADEVAQFLTDVPSGEIAMTDFTLHSIGVITARLHKRDQFKQFVSALFESAAVSVVALSPSDLAAVVDASIAYALDFDDAYQYVAARDHDLVLITFDSDFGRLPYRGMTPQLALAQRKSVDE